MPSIHPSLGRLVFAVIFAILLSTSAELSDARTWYVKVDGTGDAPTVHAAVDSTSPGDTILVAPGNYTWSNQGTGTDFGLIEIPATRTDFVLMSEGGPDVTVLDAEGQGRVLFIAGLNFMTLDGFTITGGVAPAFGDFSGGGIGMHLSHDLIKNCIIEDNTAEFGAGIWCGGVSSPTFENVVIRNNTADFGGGILFVNSSLLPTLMDVVIHDNLAIKNGGGIYAFNNGISLENTIVARNRALGIGGAIYSTASEISFLVGCTFIANRAPLSGFLHVQGGIGFSVGRCNIVGTLEGAPVNFGAGAMLQAQCNNMWDNAVTDAFPSGTIDIGGNFSRDPQFCSEFGVTYEISESSPCAPGLHPGGDSCGLIGAVPVACVDVPVLEYSWGAIKRLYQ